MATDIERIGLISDIHGNFEALRTVLEDMPEVDAMVCAGDIVGYGPSSERCLREIQRREIPPVVGNHDRAVAEGRAYESGDEYAHRYLDSHDLDWLGTLPRERTLFDGRVKVVHDHPVEQDRYTFPEDFESSLLGDEDLLVLGHTHVQHAEVFEEGAIVNPGSVGQPRDRDPRAAYATVDLSTLDVNLHRTEYDIERVKVRIKNISEISNRNAKRLEEGR